MLEVAVYDTKPNAREFLSATGGKRIDSRALVHALKSRQVGSVALDVYEEEEGIFFQDLSSQVLQDDVLSRLLSFPNVLITSRQGILTHEGLSEIARVTVENVVKLERGGAFVDGTML